jgi:hypothetical protein
MAEIHEYVVFKFKGDIAGDEQLAIMRALDPLVAPLGGFRSREYFYSEADNRWVDHVVWASIEEAHASEAIMDDPVAKRLFERMDQDTLVFGRYARAGSS